MTFKHFLCFTFWGLQRYLHNHDEIQHSTQHHNDNPIQMSCWFNRNIYQWTKSVVPNDQQGKKYYSDDYEVNVHVDEGIGEIPDIIIFIYSLIFMGLLCCHVRNNFLLFYGNNRLFFFIFSILRIVFHLDMGIGFFLLLKCWSVDGGMPLVG